MWEKTEVNREGSLGIRDTVLKVRKWLVMVVSRCGNKQMRRGDVTRGSGSS